MERIQKVIANRGYCSRRQAEKLLLEGKVKVNGVIIKELGYKVRSNDQIEVEGFKLNNESKEYILFNKPRGVVTTTSDEFNRKKVMDFINIDKRLYPVGRLDYDTTGLLLITNDGQLANLIMHPNNKVKKKYIVKIKGVLTKENKKRLEEGVVINHKKTLQSKVVIKKVDFKKQVSIIEITIFEGKNQQVKKMFQIVGHEVLKLKREQIEFLTLGKLKPGEYRFLKKNEVERLYALIRNGKGMK